MVRVLADSITIGHRFTCFLPYSEGTPSSTPYHAKMPVLTYYLRIGHLSFVRQHKSCRSIMLIVIPLLFQGFGNRYVRFQPIFSSGIDASVVVEFVLDGSWQITHSSSTLRPSCGPQISPPGRTNAETRSSLIPSNLSLG